MKVSFIMFIALMLVLSTFLIIADMSPNNTDARYNGVQFNYNQNERTFLFQFNDQTIRSHAHTIDAQSHRLSVENSNVLKNSPRIGISETKKNASELEPLAAFTLAEGLRKGRNVNIVRGYSDSTPLLDCESASQLYPIIIFRSAEENKLSEENNCIEVEYADQSYLFIVKDSILYHALGIIVPTS